MDTELFAVETGARRVTDLTPIVASFCDGRDDGLCHVSRRTPPPASP